MTAPGSGTVRGFAGPAVTPAPLLRGEYKPTEREYEALRAVVRQGGGRSAAEALGVSEGTIKKCLEHLRMWHRADSTTHLAALVMRDVGDIFGPRAEWRVP